MGALLEPLAERMLSLNRRRGKEIGSRDDGNKKAALKGSLRKQNRLAKQRFNAARARSP
jgi:hypothetical protein